MAQRQHILWFGSPPSPASQREIVNRNCLLRDGDPAVPATTIRDARAAVVAIDETNEAAMLEMVEREAARLADYGLRVDLIALDDAAAGRIQARLDTAVTMPGVKLHTAPQAAALAEAIARHDAGAAPRLDLRIAVPDHREGLRQADRPLFERAFAQCSEITLVELGGGRSEARVFAVHMTIERSNIGAWPQPAFVKLDRRDKVAVEHDNYRSYAERFIPFGLRPNIDTMIVGSEHSLLVGNFVDRSESLWDLARRNVAGEAITALLEETLGGWRDQAYARDPERGAVAAAMRVAGLWDPDHIQPYYVERAADVGIKATPQAMWQVLAALDQQFRMAPIHGDLHGENVRVRGHSAILIDLASVCIAPLTADLAALETWLAFELPPEADKQRFEDLEWATTIERLYRPEYLSPSAGTLSARDPPCMDRDSGPPDSYARHRHPELPERVSDSGCGAIAAAMPMGRWLCRGPGPPGAGLSHRGGNRRHLKGSDRMTDPARKIRWRGIGEYRDETEPLLERPGDVAGVFRGRPRSLLMACPDGCGDTLVINLDDRAGKAWRLDERRGKLSLYPSVWREDGCRSHFILWSDHLIWIGRFEAGNDEPAYDAALEQRALALLERERFQDGSEIARQLDEISWDVIRALRRLVTKGRAVEGTGHQRGNFRRSVDGKPVASS